jgi:membrane protease subunit HflK
MPWSNQGGGGGGGDGWQGGGGGGGGGGGQSPWGRGSGGPQPPDIEGLLRKGQDRLKRFLPGGFGGGRGAALIISLALAVWLGSGFYQVAPDEQGVELIFGKWSPATGVTQPGLNYNWPAPIGQVYKPKVTLVNRIEIGFRSGQEGTRNTLTRQVSNEALMLTGDENIIDINFVVLWVINDAGKFLFNIRDAQQSITDVAESAMREVIGKTKANYARAEGRLDVEVKTRELLQKTLDEYGAGVLITQLQLQKVDPPEAVIDAFRDVQRARADRERAINDAQGYANSIIPLARGEAARLIEESNAYKAEVVARSEGDAERFLAVYEAYKTGRDVTVRRIYLETMEGILKGMNKIIIDGKGAGNQGVLPYLPLPELRAGKKGGG